MAPEVMLDHAQKALYKMWKCNGKFVSAEEKRQAFNGAKIIANIISKGYTKLSRLEQKQFKYNTNLYFPNVRWDEKKI